MCAMFIVACGDSAPVTPEYPTTTSVEEVGPPWESLSDEDAATYVEDFACVEATEMVTDMMGWVPVSEEAPAEIAPGQYIEVLMGPSGLIGLLQYREGEPRVVEMGLLMLSEESMILFLDYHVLRAFHTGAASPDDDSSLSLATGEYFCVYM